MSIPIEQTALSITVINGFKAFFKLDIKAEIYEFDADASLKRKEIAHGNIRNQSSKVGLNEFFFSNGPVCPDS